MRFSVNISCIVLITIYALKICKILVNVLEILDFLTVWVSSGKVQIFCESIPTKTTILLLCLVRCQFHPIAEGLAAILCEYHEHWIKLAQHFHRLMVKLKTDICSRSWRRSVHLKSRFKISPNKKLLRGWVTLLLIGINHRIYTIESFMSQQHH